MQIQIFSALAAIGGSEDGFVWSSEIEHTVIFCTKDELENFQDTQILNILFRFFNVVDISDRERLLEIDYKLPSLSVGDFIGFKRENDEGFNVYRVATVGFDKISGNADVIPELLMRN